VKRAFGEIAVSELSNPIRGLWYSRHEEPQPQEFDGLPDWMAIEPQEADPDLGLVVEYLLWSLPAREAKIIRLRFWHECTHQEIADMLGVSTVRVGQIEKRALEILRHPNRLLVLTLAADLPKRYRNWERAPRWDWLGLRRNFDQWLAEERDPEIL